jgi:hypothetical protein
MANDPVVDAPVVDPPVVDPPVVDPPVVDPVVPPLAPTDELSVLKERLARYESLVASPEYAEFLAAKSRQVATPPAAPSPKQYTAEEKQAFQDKLNNMTRAEFAAFVRDLTVDVVREQMFTPVVQSIVSDKVQNQIAEAAAEFKDFWDYKQDMIVLSNTNPALSAKQVYHLAKASRGTPTPPAGKPPLRKPTGEAPGGPPASHKEAPVEGFNAAFEKAFQKSGLPG